MAERASLVSATTTANGILAYIRDPDGNITELLNKYPNDEVKSHLASRQRDMLMTRMNNWVNRDSLGVKCPYANLATFIYGEGDTTKQAFFFQDTENRVVARSNQPFVSEQVIEDHCLPQTAIGLAKYATTSKVVLFYQGRDGDLYYRTLHYDGNTDSWLLSENKGQFLATAATGTSLGVTCREDLSQVTVYFQNVQGQLVENTLVNNSHRWSSSGTVTVNEKTSGVYQNIAAVCSNTDEVKVYAQEQTWIFEFTRGADGRWNRTNVTATRPEVEFQICRPEDWQVRCHYLLWWDDSVSLLRLHVFTDGEWWPQLPTLETSTLAVLHDIEDASVHDEEREIANVNSVTKPNGDAKRTVTTQVAAVQIYHTKDRVDDVILIYSDGGTKALYNKPDLFGEPDVFKLEEGEEVAVIWHDGDIAEGETRRFMLGTSFARTTGWYGIKSDNRIEPHYIHGKVLNDLQKDTEQPFIWADWTSGMDIVRIIGSLESAFSSYDIRLRAIQSIDIQYYPFVASVTNILENAKDLAAKIKYVNGLTTIGEEHDPDARAHLDSQTRLCRHLLKGIFVAFGDLRDMINSVRGHGGTSSAAINAESLNSEHEVLERHITIWDQGVTTYIAQSKAMLEDRVTFARERRDEVEEMLQKSPPRAPTGIQLTHVVEPDVVLTQGAQQVLERADQLRDQAYHEFDEVRRRFEALKHRMEAIREGGGKQHTTSQSGSTPLTFPQFDESLKSPQQFAIAFKDIWNRAKEVEEIKGHLNLDAGAWDSIDKVSKQNPRA